MNVFDLYMCMFQAYGIEMILSIKDNLKYFFYTEKFQNINLIFGTL